MVDPPSHCHYDLKKAGSSFFHMQLPISEEQQAVIDPLALNTAIVQWATCIGEIRGRFWSSWSDSEA